MMQLSSGHVLENQVPGFPLRIFLSRQDKSSFLCFILSGQKKLASISFQLHSPVPVFLFLDSFIPLFETNGLNTQLKLYMCFSQTIFF